MAHRLFPRTEYSPSSGADFGFGDSNPLLAQLRSQEEPFMTVAAQSSHPNFGHLSLLVFEAVMEVVCVSLPGYIVARVGMFDANAQKFVANLNMTLFTPCLIFSKLASQLSGDRLLELIVIPFILLAQTIISWLCAQVLTRIFRIKKLPQKNFVTAMAVFGNSNSLPLSLVISLSHTISGLHWDKIPGDNDSEVAARGILYLLVFSQLGQAVRWSWGMISLLKPLDQYTPEQRGEIPQDEERRQPYEDSPSSSRRSSIVDDTPSSGSRSQNALENLSTSTGLDTATNAHVNTNGQSPQKKPAQQLNGHSHFGEAPPHGDESPESGALLPRTKRSIKRQAATVQSRVTSTLKQGFGSLPEPLQQGLTKCWFWVSSAVESTWACMNVPLAAIIISILVAVIPPFKAFFFTPKTFVNNSVTRAIQQSGNVAVPLILVVLGANLAANTLPPESIEEVGTKAEQTKMLYLSLASRMVVPTICMAPLLALTAKYVPVSILDDPIFVIVCFLLTGAPSALQLAQMCQVNGVFVGVVSRLLFHSYVICSQGSLMTVKNKMPLINSRTDIVKEEQEDVSPPMIGQSKDVDPLDLDGSFHGQAAMEGKRHSRMKPSRGSTSAAIVAASSRPELRSDDSFGASSESGANRPRPKHGKKVSSRPSQLKSAGDGTHLTRATSESGPQESGDGDDKELDQVFHQISAWIAAEKKKHQTRRGKKAREGSEPSSPIQSDQQTNITPLSRHGSTSESSDHGFALEKLEGILKHGLNLREHKPRRFGGTSRRGASRQRSFQPSLARKLSRKSTAASSDTEYHDGDVLVPSCDVTLDNTKTLPGYSKDVLSQEEQADPSKTQEKSWSEFKHEIVRLAHTLRLKGWRQVPLDYSEDINVQRLSGALTNAVYVVSPPPDLPPRDEQESKGQRGQRPRKNPSKLLLRIYGPQVEHLIDREAELQILRRLARKRIGPRLLGTFKNGRFEEYFYAHALTPKELKTPDVYMQIAKRMRELHDGIELLPEERNAGPFIWRNWDKWADRCERIVSYIDSQVLSSSPSTATKSFFKRRGMTCGVEWPVFKEMVEKYRKWLNDQYGGPERVREELVFSHNDTQYGNILRLDPPGESPLLLPANSHRRLIVIDFEYANANTRGLEFANHFTEWCYDYHEPTHSYACNTALYPRPEEQQRFIKAYLRHRAPMMTAVPTPNPGTRTGPSSMASSRTNTYDSLSSLPSRTRQSSAASMQMLTPSAFQPEEDNRLTRTDSPAQIDERPEPDEASVDAQVKQLTREAQLWRLANTAQWVAWGIVQARVPGLEDYETAKNMGKESHGADKFHTSRQTANVGRDPQDERHSEEEEDDDNDEDGDPESDDDSEEFDYLRYARSRAMFFWSDCVRMGFVKAEDLPKATRDELRIIPY
ncbi:MAG: hypothetical protein M1831_000570 [Alyxoria varia]|nr:MAG: hypothetical protein M1831_000570 [Alyxoria varia]